MSQPNHTGQPGRGDIYGWGLRAHHEDHDACDPAPAGRRLGVWSDARYLPSAVAGAAAAWSDDIGGQISRAAES